MNERDMGQLTPLMLAARNRHSNCIMALFKNSGAGELPCPNPHSRVSLCNQMHDFNGVTVLHWLASNGRAAPLVLLLDDGFDISTQDCHLQVRWHGTLWMLQVRLT